MAASCVPWRFRLGAGLAFQIAQNEDDSMIIRKAAYLLIEDWLQVSPVLLIGQVKQRPVAAGVYGEREMEILAPITPPIHGSA